MDNIIYVRNIVNSNFENCVFYGNSDKELTVDTLPSGTVDFNFSYNLIKRDEIYSYANYANIIWNEDPQFTDASMFDFSFESGSPLNDAGVPTFVTSDLKGVTRNMSNPDIGCYEN